MAGRDAIALLREKYEAFNRGDLDAVLRDTHQAFELQRPHGGGVVRGRQAVLEHLRPDAFDEEGETPLEFVEHGDAVLVRSRSFSRGAGSGIEIDQEMFHVWRIRDGLPARVELYMDRDEAYRAAGLRA